MRWAISVIAVRYLCVLFGGACAGLAGGYLSLVYTPQWIENMTAGRGWIALALVVFASWLPWRVWLGAYLFGTVSILALRCPGHRLGNSLAVPVVAALPRDHHRAGDHFRQPVLTRKYAGLPRPAFRA